MAKNITFVLIFLLVVSFSFVSSRCEKGQVDINSASAVELQKIKGIGPVYSERIVEERPFNSLDDLVRVKGIGEKTLLKIKEEGLACVNGVEIPVVKNATIEQLYNNTSEEDKDFIGFEVNETLDLDEKIKSENILTSETIKEKNIILNPEKTENDPILLNSLENSQGEELIYESKNSKILFYAPYAFSCFLLLVIGFLVLSRS